ncbi:MAG: L,D-transpeptidase family protein [Proteobacteria bacterium]|nr:L,D-transpeptidase family protein [Pseudomonadota bacterium]
MRRGAALLFLLAAPAALAEAPVASPPAPQVVPPADLVVVHKGARTLELYTAGRRTLTIAGLQLGPEPLGPKHFLGDGRTPEGRYVIDRANPDSAYHRALHISYPAPADLAYARAHGRRAGGALFLHGQPNDWPGPGRAPGDWTEGCIALADDEIDLLWQVVADGTPIEILP